MGRCIHASNRKLKDHSKLKRWLNKILEDNVIDIFYPQRLSELEDVCLYDFHYELQGVDKHGSIQSLSFQTTSCLIVTMKAKEKSFSTLLFSSSLHSEMKVVYFMTKKLIN